MNSKVNTNNAEVIIGELLKARDRKTVATKYKVTNPSDLYKKLRELGFDTEIITKGRRGAAKKVAIPGISREMTCNYPGCNRKFISNLDDMGVPYKKRCPRCDNVLKMRGYRRKGAEV